MIDLAVGLFLGYMLGRLLNSSPALSWGFPRSKQPCYMEDCAKMIISGSKHVYIFTVLPNGGTWLQREPRGDVLVTGSVPVTFSEVPGGVMWVTLVALFEDFIGFAPWSWWRERRQRAKEYPLDTRPPTIEGGASYFEESDL